MQSASLAMRVGSDHDEDEIAAVVFGGSENDGHELDVQGTPDAMALVRRVDNETGRCDV